MTDHDTLRYPVGPFRPTPALTPEERSDLMDEMENFPATLRSLVESLTETQLEATYREGGWTVRQVIHHIPDSHMQGYVRFKLAVSETRPTIKTYRQAAWGEMVDARVGAVDLSLRLLEALHARWVLFLRSLEEEDFARTYLHPELGEISLEATLQLYAWHGRHHLGHIQLVAKGA